MTEWVWRTGGVIREKLSNAKKIPVSMPLTLSQVLVYMEKFTFTLPTYITTKDGEK
jgi:hypothetical protein